MPRAWPAATNAAPLRVRRAGREYLDSVAGKMLENYTVDVQRSATTVTVTVHATVSSVVPFGTYTVTETASAPIEKYVVG